LFELFVDLFPPQTTFDLLRSQRQAHGPTPEQWTAHFAQFRQSFYNFLAQAVSLSSMAFQHQLLLRTMMAESKGLSKRGRELFAQLGVLLPTTSYRRKSSAPSPDARDWSSASQTREMTASTVSCSKKLRGMTGTTSLFAS